MPVTNQLKQIEHAELQLKKALSLTDREFDKIFSSYYHKKKNSILEYDFTQESLLNGFKIRKECGIKSKRAWI